MFTRHLIICFLCCYIVSVINLSAADTTYYFGSNNRPVVDFAEAGSQKIIKEVSSGKYRIKSLVKTNGV